MILFEFPLFLIFGLSGLILGTTTLSECAIAGITGVMGGDATAARLDDEDEWQEGPFEDPGRDREHDWLCPERYAVVEGDPETREWTSREYPVSS